MPAARVLTVDEIRICPVCGDRIGVHEPVVFVSDPRRSWGERDAALGVVAMHANCVDPRWIALEQQGRAAAARQRERARQRARDLLRLAGALHDSHQGETNIEYVARLWDAVRTGGVLKLAGLVPPDVEWRSIHAEGRVLRGTRELHEYWDGRNLELELPTPRMFRAYGDDVLVECEHQIGNEEPAGHWSLYRFDGSRLIQAVSFHDETEAVNALAASGLD